LAPFISFSAHRNLDDAMTYLASNKPITLPELARMKKDGEKIAMLTGYDASFAALEDRCGVDMILIGDSLGNVLQGKTSTLPVTIEHMIYHTECVGHIVQRPMVVADMPFGSYYESKEQAMRNAVRLMAAGAEMVKLEGGEVMAETVRFLTARGIPVCAHIGLTPQSVHALGGYRVQGRGDEGAARMKAEASALEQAGAALMVLEMVPAQLAGEITQQLTACATIGIGAGKDCDGQVLVLHDMLGVYPGKKGRFVKDFMAEAQSIDGAVIAYVKAVKDGSFPGPEHCY
jgi:3-methyl-2-oxobutanoate hydroxymethyltransferase